MKRFFYCLSLIFLSTRLLAAELDNNLQNNGSQNEGSAFEGCRRVKHKHCRHHRNNVGPHGATGATGAAGAAGATGATGATGPTGTGFFEAGFVSVSGLGLGTDISGTPIPLQLDIGDNVASQLINAGGVVNVNAENGVISWDAGTSQIVLNAPGYYHLSYGVVPTTLTANALVSIRSSTNGDIPGSVLNPSATSTIETVSTIYQSIGGGERLSLFINDSPTQAAVVNLAAPAPNIDIIFYLQGIRIL